MTKQEALQILNKYTDNITPYMQSDLIRKKFIKLSKQNADNILSKYYLDETSLAEQVTVDKLDLPSLKDESISEFIINSWKDASHLAKSDIYWGYKVREGNTTDDVWKKMSIKDRLQLNDAVKRDVNYSIPKKVARMLIGFIPQMIEVLTPQEYEVYKPTTTSLFGKRYKEIMQEKSLNNYTPIHRLVDLYTGNAMKEFIDANISPETAKPLAQGVGMVGATVDILPIGLVFKAFGGSHITSKILTKALKESLKTPTFKKIIAKNAMDLIKKTGPVTLSGVAAGGIGEFTQVMARKVGEELDKEVDNIEKLPLSEALLRVGLTATTGGLLASLPLLPGRTLAFINDLKSIKTSQIKPITNIVPTKITSIQPEIKVHPKTNIVKYIIKEGGLNIKDEATKHLVDDLHLPAQLTSPEGRVTLETLHNAGFNNIRDKLTKSLNRITLSSLLAKNNVLGIKINNIEKDSINQRISRLIQHEPIFKDIDIHLSIMDNTKPLMYKKAILKEIVDTDVIFTRNKKLLHTIINSVKPIPESYSSILNTIFKENETIFKGIIDNKILNLRDASSKNVRLQGLLHSISENMTSSKLRDKLKELFAFRQTFYPFEKIVPKHLEYIAGLLDDYYSKPMKTTEMAHLLSELSLLEKSIKYTTSDYVINRKLQVDDIVESIVKDPISKPLDLRYEIPDTNKMPSKFWKRTIQRYKGLINALQAQSIINLNSDMMFQQLGNTINNFDNVYMTKLVTPIQRLYSNYLQEKTDIMNNFWGKIKRYKLTEADEYNIANYVIQLQNIKEKRLIASGLSTEPVKLTSKQMEVAQYMLDTFKQLKPRLGEYMRRVHNVNFIEHDNYFRLDMDWDKITDDTLHNFSDIIRKSDVSQYKQRDPKVTTPVRTDVFNVFRQAVDKTLYSIHLGEKVDVLKHVVDNVDFQTKAGKYGTILMKEWHNVLDRNGGVEKFYKTEWLDTLMRRTGIAILAGKLMPTLVQTTGVLFGGAKVGFNVVKGMHNFINKPEWRKFINQYSPAIKGRFAGEFDLRTLSETPTRHVFAHHALAPLKNTDGAAASAVFISAYEKRLKEKGLDLDLNTPNQDALDYAHWVVRSTSGSGLALDLPLSASAGMLVSPIKVSKKHVSISRALLQLQTVLSTIYGLKYEMIKAGIRGDFKNAAQILFWTFLAALSESQIRDKGREFFNYITGLEENESESDWYKDWITTYLTDVPVVGRLYNAYKYKSSYMTVEKGLESMYGSIQLTGGLKRYITEEDEKKKKQAIRSMKSGAIKAAEGTAALTGVVLGDVPSLLKKLVRKKEDEE